MKKILVFNVGSSTLRFSLFENKEKTLQGIYERLKKPEDYKKAFNEISKELQNEIRVKVLAILNELDIRSGEVISFGC